MIHWMSEDVSNLIDTYTDGNGTYIPLAFVVCEGAEKGHIELLCEVTDEFSTHIILGDCSSLTDAEINERFIREFAKVAVSYKETCETANEIVANYLESLADAMARTL